MAKSKYVNMSVRRELLQRYGHSEDCPGCSFVKSDLTYYMGHNAQCRKRIIEHMMRAEQLKAEQERIEEVKKKGWKLKAKRMYK